MSCRVGHLTKLMCGKVWRQVPALLQRLKIDHKFLVDRGVLGLLQVAQDIPHHHTTSYKASHEGNALPLLAISPMAMGFMLIREEDVV